jgi:hypothetical protein
MSTAPTTSSTATIATAPAAFAPKLKRSQTWLTRELDTYLRESQTKPFAWGSNDCCLFAANGIQAMTGVDIADDFRGKYTDQAAAFALIKAVTGGTTVADAAAHCAVKHGLVEWVGKTGKPLPLMAKRGDLVVVTNAGQLIAGIVDLSGRYVAAMSETGIVRLSLSAIQRAWNVPY